MSDSESDPDYLPSHASGSSQSESSYDDETSLASDNDIALSELRTQSLTLEWHYPEDSRQKQFPLDIQPGISVPSNCEMELDCFRLFLTDEIINLMVQMTNSYANKSKLLNVVTRNMRIAKWTNCTPEEMWKFLGLLVYMGLKKLPKISDYWSKNILYENKVAGQTMAMNRFELLLRCWHFEDTVFIGSNHADRPIKMRR